MGNIRHATLTSELAGDRVGASEWDAAHDISLAIADITGLQDALDAAGETPAIADVTGLQAALDAKADDTDLASYQPVDSDLTAIAALTTTAFGRAFLALADAAALRTAGGLGTLATQSGTFSGTSSGTNTGDQDLSSYATTSAVAAGYQPLDSDLTAIAALTTTAYGRAVLALADAAALRTAAGLGSIATQAASNVTITGGSVTGITDLAVGDGGTGSSTAAGAATNLGLGTGDSPQFTAVNLGHASDTTLTRTGAGQIAVEGNAVYHAGNKPTESIIIACSDETTAITTGTAKVTFRMPYAFTVSDVRASVNTAPTGSTILIDINEGGTTILSTKLMIDASEKTSTTAATPAVISDTSLADDAEITVDFDQVGSTISGKGVKVVLIGTRT